MKLPYQLKNLGNSQPVLEHSDTGAMQVATNTEIELHGLLQKADGILRGIHHELQSVIENLDLMLEGPKKNKGLEQIRERLGKLRLDLERFPE